LFFEPFLGIVGRFNLHLVLSFSNSGVQEQVLQIGMSTAQQALKAGKQDPSSYVFSGKRMKKNERV
jgi:hypothetical protein